MTDHFTNMDSLWLQMLSDRLRENPAMEDELGYVSLNLDEVFARLRSIAQNLQSLDERNQVLSSNRSYADGYAAAEAAMRRRSNVLVNPEGEDVHGASILDQINRRVAEGNLKKIALGERALEDKPHEFNAPVRRKPQAAKPKAAVPSVDLDLSFLGDL